MHTFEGSKNQSTTQNEVTKLINNHRVDDCYLDLSGHCLNTVPQDLLNLVHLQDLYLEGNCITNLPDNFFERLPALQWLDLRNNQLKCLPSSIGRHKSIKHLLLEGNNLTHLPLQMGMTKSLKGLNLRGNPLQMPPMHIVHQGVYVILSYLYQELQNSQKGKSIHVTSSNEKANINPVEAELVFEDDLLLDNLNLSERRDIPSPSDEFDLLKLGATPLLASLHKPLTLKTYKTKFQARTDVTKSQGMNNQDKLKGLRLQKSAEKFNNQQLKKIPAAVLDEETTNVGKRKTLSPIKSITGSPSFAYSNSSIQINKEEAKEEMVDFVFPKNRARSLSPVERTINDPRKTRELYQNTYPKVPELPSIVFQRSDISSNRTEIINGVEKTDLEAITKPYAEKLSRPNSVILKNVDIQQRMKLHSSHMHQRLKKQRGDDEEITKPQTAKEIQRQLFNDKIKKDAQMEYRFRAFTGDSVSVQSSSNKTGSL